MKPRNALVLGMARSGTSLTASLFVRQGYYAAGDDDLVPEDHLNPTGYWESRDVLRANADVLHAAGFEPDNTWMFEPIHDEQVRRIAELEITDAHRALVERYEEHAPWVWKDPRLCYTLPYWWPALRERACGVVLVRRDVDAIFASFVRVGWVDPTPEARREVETRTRDHLAAAERAIEALGVPALSIRYGDFAERPLDVARKVNDLFGLTLEPGDLGYDARYNHSSLLGRVGTVVDRLANRLPRSWMKVAKRLTPRSFLERLYPERYR